MSILGTLVEPVTGLLDKFIEDKDQKAKLAHELATMADRHAQEALLAQLAINKEEATDIAMSVDPDTSEVLEVTSTTVDYIETFDNLEKS